MIELDYVQYALKNYTTPLFNEDEFTKDLNKIIVLKKLFRRFTTTGEINERLVLNNFIILINVFGVEATNKLLFHRVEKEHWSIVKTFLVFLNSYIEDDIQDIELDKNIVTILGDIRWRSHSF